MPSFSRNRILLSGYACRFEPKPHSNDGGFDGSKVCGLKPRLLALQDYEGSAK